MLILVHTIIPLIRTFETLCGELLPGVPVKHILDEPLLEAVRQRGRLDAADASRLSGHARAAEVIGARAILVTCSTISPLVDQIDARIPVIKIDAGMIAAAVQQGTRIGVMATNRTTMEPTRSLLAAEADRSGKAVQIDLRFVDGAMAALLAGDGAAHDRLIATTAHEMAPHFDVIVLAQASMARALASISETPCPVLSSPHIALAHVKEILGPGGRNVADR